MTNNRSAVPTAMTTVTSKVAHQKREGAPRAMRAESQWLDAPGRWVDGGGWIEAAQESGV